jgi:6-phosphogluconolactonase
MASTLKIYADKSKLAEILAIDFSTFVKRLLAKKELVSIALSGGSTPTLFFRAMAAQKPEIDWNRVRFFWVDERCVPPDHPESNFGVAFIEFLNPLSIPESSFFRIRGEEDPESEALRYSELILDKVSCDLTFPVFDLVFLGMGTDGHTASVFPHQAHLWKADSLCAVGTHPITGQKRVTFTGHLINAAKKVVFTVTGGDKAEIAGKVIRKSGNYLEYPASFVAPFNGELEWYLDSSAAKMID